MDWPSVFATKRRTWRVPAAVLSLVMASWIFPPATSAWSHGCDGVNNYTAFAGMLEFHPLTTGARAKIEYANPTLCTSPAPGESSFSSVWTAVAGADANDVDGLNIYQVGIDKCQNGAASGCPSGVNNVPYYFYAYGRMSGPNCGTSVAPQPQKAPRGLATNDSWWFTIIKSGSNYLATIAGSEQYRKGAFYLETCWTSTLDETDGVDTAEYMNEVQDPFSQSGGSVADPQLLSSVTWYDAAGTHSLSRPYSQICDSYPKGWQQGGQRCYVLSTAHDGWNSWDSRQP